jgi:2-polyprenyl-3-methyl-5-hydroxy-6-metoxy-1,4-benzoquinol methylase
MEWSEHQAWERDWWGDCTNTYAEETKQLTYAHRMGLTVVNDGTGKWPQYDLAHKNILDIGGGPVSMLLRTINPGPYRVVAEPCAYPQWVEDRYDIAGIELVRVKGEDLSGESSWTSDWPDEFDEVWIYNVLQHVDDPELIVKNAIQRAKCVRIFEWVDTRPMPGHPHTLTADAFGDWFGEPGTVEQMNENGCRGPAWYGAFQA